MRLAFSIASLAAFAFGGGLVAEEIRVAAPSTDCRPTETEVCSLGAAITAANERPGADVIRLVPEAVYRLDTIDHQNEGGNGLPAITSEITIEGDGAAIERSLDFEIPEFRLFRVAEEGALTLRDLTLRHGATPRGFDGAGVWNVGRLTVERCVIEDNHSGDDGGGIRNDGHLWLTDSLVRNNTARWRGGVGGGLQNPEQFGQAEVVIERTTFVSNEAWAVGGALWMEGSALISNSTFSANRAGSRGGAIQNYGSLELRSCTITDNQANVNGGGLHSFAKVRLSNTIIAGNRAMISAECEGRLQSDGYNLLGELYRCTLEGDATGDVVGARPRLRSLAAIDGISVHLPAPGSPAIDAGHPGAPGTSDAACPASDQLGRARDATDGCDIGAVEWRQGS